MLRSLEKIMDKGYKVQGARFRVQDNQLFIPMLRDEPPKGMFAAKRSRPQTPLFIINTGDLISADNLD